MNIHHKLMETFRKYSGAPSELQDLTPWEFTTFRLSQASLQHFRKHGDVIHVFLWGDPTN